MAEQPVVEEVEKIEAPKMADTIADKWREIQARKSEEAPAEETAKPGKPRDDAGKFAKPAPASETAEATEAPKKLSFVPKWKKEALEKWAQLDPNVQAEVERREQDFHKGIEDYKTGAAQSKEWEQAVGPYLPAIKAYGVTPQQAATHLFNIETVLRTGLPQQKLALIAQVCRDYQIPIQALFGGQQAQQPQLDPNVQVLYQRLSQLEGHLTQQQKAATSAQEQSLSEQIAKFSKDKEHFEILKPRMAALLQAGVVTDLESAYDHAFRTDPVTAPIFLAEQQDKWKTEAKAKAESARKAAGVNIRPKGSVATSQKLNGSMSETISTKARELGLIN